jgi:hypothetical protein
MRVGANGGYSQTCLTLCLNIISWKIWPPFIPTNEWSISGCLKGWRGWTSSLTERLKAGLGTARAGEVCEAAAAAAVLCVLFSTFDCDVAGFGDLYGETAATGRDVEKWRARSDKRRARFGACDESILDNLAQSIDMRVRIVCKSDASVSRDYREFGRLG